MLEYLAVFLGPFLGAVIQALAGFGFAIVFMIFVPHFLGLVDAGSLSAMISFPQNILMYLTYRKHVRYKKVLVATIPYIIVSTSLIRILPDMDVSLLRSIFGIFLIILGLYYIIDLIRQKRTHGQAKEEVKEEGFTGKNILIGFVFGLISGISGGLFSIGGPLLALYYLAVSDSREEYMGNLNFNFTLTSLFNNIARLFVGLYRPELLVYLIIGFIGMFIGNRFGTVLSSRINGDYLKILIYALIMISGINALI